VSHWGRFFLWHFCPTWDTSSYFFVLLYSSIFFFVYYYNSFFIKKQILSEYFYLFLATILLQIVNGGALLCQIKTIKIIIKIITTRIITIITKIKIMKDKTIIIIVDSCVNYRKIEFITYVNLSFKFY